MPDVTRQLDASVEDTLNWVGMERIALPLQLQAHEHHVYPVHAKVNAYVDLAAPKAKGIHMSRLYLALDQLTETTVTPQDLIQLLQDFMQTHSDLSCAAKAEFDFDLLLKRRSLLSDKSGWKSYSCSIAAVHHQASTDLQLKIAIPYSSTCPCSAALARQLIQQAFVERFSDDAPLNQKDVYAWLGTTQGIVATPHSQRSDAEISITIDPKMTFFPFLYIVNLVEEVLQTAVQTAVKREDEQEFARLNGQNLMFVEDAARKLKCALSVDSIVQDFTVRVAHYESLHAHDAVAVAHKD